MGKETRGDSLSRKKTETKEFLKVLNFKKGRGGGDVGRGSLPRMQNGKQ